MGNVTVISNRILTVLAAKVAAGAPGAKVALEAHLAVRPANVKEALERFVKACEL